MHSHRHRGSADITDMHASGRVDWAEPGPYVCMAEVSLAEPTGDSALVVRESERFRFSTVLLRV